MIRRALHDPKEPLAIVTILDDVRFGGTRKLEGAYYVRCPRVIRGWAEGRFDREAR